MTAPIVVASLEPWDDVWRRNQYVIDGLLRADPQRQVLFIEPPTDPVHDVSSGRPPRMGRGLRVAEGYEGRLQLLSQEEYVSIICDQLEIIPEHIVIHRITGDAPRDMLIGPMWSLNKWEVLNAIEAEMRRRGSKQGCKAKEQKFVC